MQDTLGDRMKAYEAVSKNYLIRRVPAIIRIDGKAFHTFTRGFIRPFDYVLHATMSRTLEYLCKNVQGCVFGYTQSDEITLVLTDYATINTDSWFGYSVQKMCSIAASMATLAFNEEFMDVCWEVKQAGEDISVYKEKYMKAMFDARAFSVPVSDVCNCLIWRQKDATRNSILSVGQANLPRSVLHGKKCDEIQDLLWKEKGINWDSYPIEYKRGVACYRVEQEIEVPENQQRNGQNTATRRYWCLDKGIPIFTQDRNFIEKWL